MTPASNAPPGTTPRGRLSGTRVLLGFGLFVGLVFGSAVLFYFSELETRLDYEAEKQARVRDFKAAAAWIDATEGSSTPPLSSPAALPDDAPLRLRFTCDDPVLLYVWRESAGGTRPLFPEDPRQTPQPIRPDEPLELPYEEDGTQSHWTLDARRPVTLHVRATARRDTDLENALASGRSPDLESTPSPAFGELVDSRGGVLHWTLDIPESARDASSPR